MLPLSPPCFSSGEERRCSSELRFSLGSRKLEGIAAPFNTETRIGGFSEVIAPGAFTRSLGAGNDILALADHDKAKVLARTGSGSLRLRETGEGLAFSLDLPDTQAGRDIQALAERGDLGGMSFGFFVPEGGESWDGTTRTLTDIDLIEVSVVSAWPAYSGTEIALRSMNGSLASMRRKRALALARAATWA